MACFLSLPIDDYAMGLNDKQRDCAQRKINAVLSEIREKFGEGVMRRGSDFLKDEDVENG